MSTEQTDIQRELTTLKKHTKRLEERFNTLQAEFTEHKMSSEVTQSKVDQNRTQIGELWRTCDQESSTCLDECLRC